MSKPRSRLIDYKALVFRQVYGFTTEIHFGRQSKHLPGHPNYNPTKSTIALSIRTIQTLVEHHAGTGRRRSRNKETVDFGIVIGIFRSPDHPAGIATTCGTIHYSKAGAHIVPALPSTKRRR